MNEDLTKDKSQKEEIKKFVKKYIEGYGNGDEGFQKDEHGRYMYKSGAQSINLASYFEDLVETYIECVESDKLRRAFEAGEKLVQQEWHDLEFCRGEDCVCKSESQLNYVDFDSWVLSLTK